MLWYKYAADPNKRPFDPFDPFTPFENKPEDRVQLNPPPRRGPTTTRLGPEEEARKLPPAPPNRESVIRSILNLLRRKTTTMEDLLDIEHKLKTPVTQTEVPPEGKIRPPTKKQPKPLIEKPLERPARTPTIKQLEETLPGTTAPAQAIERPQSGRYNEPLSRGRWWEEK